MAYGNYSSNKDANKPFEPSVYSPYRMNNGESQIDKTCLTFSMWNKNLKISISPRKENSEEMVFDMEHGISIYLNHTKAMMFAHEVKNFLRDPDTYTGSGVASGQGVITISNGKELGFEKPVLIIRKMGENGEVVSSFAYEFKTDYHYAIRNYTGGSDFSKEIEEYKNLEIEQMLTMLEEYYKAMTYTVAYTVIEGNKFNNDRIMNNLKSIAEKLGVEVARGNSQRGSSFNSATSFFNNGGNNTKSESESFPAATLDDIY